MAMNTLNDIKEILSNSSLIAHKLNGTQEEHVTTTPRNGVHKLIPPYATKSGTITPILLWLVLEKAVNYTKRHDHAGFDYCGKQVNAEEIGIVLLV